MSAKDCLERSCFGRSFKLLYTVPGFAINIHGTKYFNYLYFMYLFTKKKHAHTQSIFRKINNHTNISKDEEAGTPALKKPLLWASTGRQSSWIATLLAFPFALCCLPPASARRVYLFTFDDSGKSQKPSFFFFLLSTIFFPPIKNFLCCSQPHFYVFPLLPSWFWGISSRATKQTDSPTPC